jgi:hypothetical protein
VAAGLLGVALAVSPLLGAGRARPGVLALAAISLLALAGSFAWIRLLGLVLAGLAAELVVREAAAHLPAGAAVGYGAALLLLCELVAWARSLRSPALVDRAVVGRRVAGLVVLALFAAVASGLTVTGGSFSPPNAFVAGVGGAVAVAALLTLVWSLARRPS